MDGDNSTVTQVYQTLGWFDNSTTRFELTRQLTMVGLERNISRMESAMKRLIRHTTQYHDENALGGVLDRFERYCKVADVIIHHKERYHTNVSKQIMGPTQSMYLHLKNQLYTSSEQPQIHTHDNN